MKDLKEILTNHYRANKKRSLDRILTSWKALESFFPLEARALDLTSTRVTKYILERQEKGRANSTIRNELIACEPPTSWRRRQGSSPPSRTSPLRK